MATELKPTYGNFVLKGIVGGTQSDKFFSEGVSNNNAWRRLNFSLKVNDNASVYVEMMGSKSDKVKFVDNTDKKNKKEFQVPWADRYKERKDKAEIFMAAKVGIEKDENNKNKVHSLTQFDAVKYLNDNLKDGDSVYIRGSVNFSVYEGKSQVKYNFQQIYGVSEPVDFTVDGFEPEASFNQEIVYLGAEYDAETNRTAINTKIIYKDKTGVHPLDYMFFINHEKYSEDEEKTKALNDLKSSFERLPYGSTIKVNGNINIYIEKFTEEEIEDEIPNFGGFQAKGQETFVRGNVIRELEITGGDGSTLIQERYSEEDFVPNKDPFGDSSTGQNNNTNKSIDPFADDEDNLPFN